jgi:hypothetical protein
LHNRFVIHRFLLSARPGDVEPQTQGTAIGGVDDAPLSTLMVAQGATESAGAGFDPTGKPAGYENFHFAVHMGVLFDLRIH